MLAVERGTIEELIAANEKRLHAPGGAAFQKLGDIILSADVYIDSHACVFEIERRVFPNLAIEWQCDGDFVTENAQLARQGFERVHQRSRASERRAFSADHQDSHCLKKRKPEKA